MGAERRHRPLPSAPAITRRSLLAGTGGGVAALAAGTSGCALEPEPDPGGPLLRIAHLTDIHVSDTPAAVDGLTRALRHVQGLPNPPELLLGGGDCILDSLAADAESTAAQWACWQRVMQAELSLPMVHALGNHDVWGWALDDPALEQDPRFGKAWAMQVLGLTSRYYAFDRGPWRFVVLDSVSRVPGGYEARLDEEQWQWLAATLADTDHDTPVCVLSHVPLLSACSFLDGDNEASGDWQVPGAWLHIDARRIKDLFRSYPNVRLCLSGHSHLQDRVTYLGRSYLCDGAVSGGWWQGPYQEFGPAYALVDLYPDGGFEAELVTF